MTSPIEPRIPSTLESVYVSRRQQGQTHERAALAAIHSFRGGRRVDDPALVARAERARRSYEADQRLTAV